MTADPLAALVAIDEVSVAVDACRRAVDGLLAHRVLRRRRADVSAESLLRGAWASAVLAGSSATLAEVRSGLAADPIVQGALRVSAALAALADPWAGAQRQVLARLHALAAAGLAEPAVLGRPRADREVAHRLDLLAEVLSRTSAPALVVAAVVQGELLGLDAFPPASGVVARAAARLTLIDRGLDPRSLVVLEAGELELRDRSGSALAGYLSGDQQGVVDWVRHCGAAAELGVRESLAICAAMQRG